MEWDKDLIAIRPTFLGPRGRAWEIDVDACYALKGINRRDGADIAGWLIEAPWAHPIWHSYCLVLIHLRPKRGYMTKFYLDDATHEFWVSALDPEQARQPQIETGAWRALTPINFAAQLICGTDAEATELIRTRAVQPILEGRLSPDTDFAAQWSAIFGDNMVLK